MRAEIEELGLKAYTPEGYQEFLNTPMDVFDGHTANDLIEAGYGHRVLAALAQDYEGLGY
jgi:hypothetical protein